MTTVPKRLGVKFSLKHEPRIQPKDIVPIFQRWIQEHTVEGMLIDVIDYKHVPDGPGIVLIGDEGDYAYDLSDGQTGLFYLRKRALPDNLGDALRHTFHYALTAARALEMEAPGDIEFDFSSAKISFLDRQYYRNEPTIFAEIRDELAEILSEIYEAPVEISRNSDDPRQVFALRSDTRDANVDVYTLIRRLYKSLQYV